MKHENHTHLLRSLTRYPLARYKPLINFEDGWAKTIGWFQDNWLEGWKEKNGRSEKKTA